MPIHSEKRIMPYTQDQIFDLVADIKLYPEFLPWCSDARIRAKNGNTLRVDLVIGFKVFREGFTSYVTLDKPTRIEVRYEKGPFRYLNNHWIFVPVDGGCAIDFFVDFEFRSRIFQRLIGTVFNQAVRRMVDAFETRAFTLYGGHKKLTPSIREDTASDRA